MATFHIRGSWYVQLRSNDDRVLLRSPELETEQACRAVAARIRLSATVPERYEQRASTNGGHYFVLRDDVGEVLAMSPIHATRASCEAAMAAVRESAVRALSIAALRRSAPPPESVETRELPVVEREGPGAATNDRIAKS